ncbi:PilZ domain-containing protein [Myxococcota bacterium]|nr:PilZ domain-containing protein [Myxococcota bacterium]
MAMNTNTATPENISLMTAVTVNQGNRLPPSTLSMINLSEGGVFVQTAYPAPVGTEVEIAFTLGDSPEPVVTGSVVQWVRQGPPEMNPPPGMALAFSNLSDAHLGRIREVISVHSANVDYFTKHNSMPEGAMALAPPKMSLHFHGDTELNASLKSFSEKFLVATVALPFARKGDLMTSVMDDGTVLERGKINWLSFVQEDSSGIPSLEMGIELSLGSWGEEYLRKTTSPMGVMDFFNEEDSGDLLDYDIIDAIPASLTMVPTLPIYDESGELPPPPPEKKPVLPSEVRHYPEPVRSLTMAKNGLPELKKHIGKTDAAPRPAGSGKNSDTYPIAPTGSLIRRRGLQVLAAGVGVVVIFSLVSMNMGSPSKPRKIEKTPVSVQQEYEHLVHVSGTGPAITKGTGIALNVVKPTPPETNSAHPEASPLPGGTRGDDAEPAKKPARKIDNKKAPEASGSKGIHRGRTLPLAFDTRGKTTKIMVGTAGTPKAVSHYLLAKPHGIVINIKGAALSMPRGYRKGDGRVITRIKHVKLKKGSRMIIYTKKPPKKVRSMLTDGVVRVTFH